MPTGTTKFHVLMDRSGSVLARVRSSEEGLAALGSHLAGLMPLPAGTIRISARAFLTDESTAVLAAFPHFIRDPVVERKLEQASLRLVDRLVVDVRPDTTMVMSPTPWPALSDLPAAVGHAPAPIAPTAIRTVIIPPLPLPYDKPSQADVVSFLAAITGAGAPRADRLELADRLAATDVVTVPPGDHAALYATLRR